MGRNSELSYSDRHGYYSTINKRRFYFGRDHKAARLKFVETLAKHNRGEILANPSVSELADEFLEFKRETTSPNTYLWYEQPLLDFVSYIGPKRKVSGLGPSDIELWIAKNYSKTRHGKPTSTNSQRHPKRVVKACMQWGVDNKRIGHNPIKSLKIGDYSGSSDIPTDEQLATLLQHFADDEDLVDLLQFEILTGCRVQEARSILCEQVDLKNSQIALSEEQSKAYEKTNRLRIILMNQAAMAIVKRNLKKNVNGLLFQNPNSRQSNNTWTPGAIRSRFRRAEDELGFRITQRSLRHVWATKFLLSGGSIVAGAALLGHSTVKMLTQNYQKIVNDRPHLLSQAGLVKPIRVKKAKSQA